ncbi:hypothetical protein [Kutzneria sp. CA-103260]|uniref:hypothetical protein n=1 Tax=Kutzneria sp. CA-103260 TaxID=2802641 RepID=UPI001BA69193|nr:hypothetical protein [Kutzneria sp. CA-103260]QUQ67238.1 hypothetical protein JJ691_49720 [Kutzneria sp. CA-103260]
MITAASFPTPDLALRSCDPAELRRVHDFALEQAAAANAARSLLVGRLTPSLLRSVHSDLITWRHQLALKAPGRIGQGLPLDASRFVMSLVDGGPNYDRLGYIGRLRHGAAWDSASRTYRGGVETPAFRLMLRYGQAVHDRFSLEGNPGDVLVNHVTLPNGLVIPGNRLVRHAAAADISTALLARLSARGHDVSQVETGGSPCYAISADDSSRATMFSAALDLLASAPSLSSWQAARYLLYQSPRTKKGSDAASRVFLVAVGSVLLGQPPVLDQDVDLRCAVLGQRAATVLPSDPRE